MTERQLFITGCPGSGMALVALLLNEHPEVVLGVERYARIAGLVDPFMFDPERLVEPLLAETPVLAGPLYERLRGRVAGGAVRCVGDASAAYTGVMAELLDRLPHARIVLLVREPEAVAAELERRALDPSDVWPAANGAAAVPRLWNDALARGRALIRDRPGARVLVVPFEAFAGGYANWLDALLAFAGVSITPRLESEYERLVARLSQRVAPAGSTVDRDLELDGWRLERTARPPERIPVPEPVPWPDELALTDEEIGRRQREREQVFSEIARGSLARADELELLRGRYGAQARELVRRAARLSRAKRGLVEGLPAPDLRVSLVCPHQRLTTGGVYAIEQLATHLATIVQVRLIVRKPPVRRLPGVDVRVDPDLSWACQDTDVIVYPADMEDASQLLEALPSGSRAMMLLQGFGTPGSPVVTANLESADEVVATSSWLCEVARARGASCVYLPYGLDRDVFRPGPPSSERDPTVTAMTHQIDWKGGEDLLAAIGRVRQTRPDVEVTLYGGEPVDGAATFVLRPDRGRVAELLARSSVHVVSSWEEGFGMDACPPSSPVGNPPPGVAARASFSERSPAPMP
jgi:hypothetical protein